jgi:C1A family cysteine protease
MQQARSKAFVPSRLFVYYEERALMGTTSRDSGAYIRDGFKVISKRGVCPETQWPYDIAKFKNKPPKPCYDEALNHQAVKYQRVNQRVDDIRAVLASGTLVVFGFTVYDSFMSDAVAKSGRVPMPQKSEKRLGGHAVAAVGYDAARKVFFVRNSWGAGWGMKGYCEMPFDYLANDNLAADFWAVSLVEA